jgi:autotransporter-associated beta strand protein
MKPKFLIPGTPFVSLIVCAFVPLFSQVSHAQTDGTWTAINSGKWSAPANWSGGNVASGATATANFSTVNITDNRTVTLDAPFTIGTLTAQDATTASHNWTFDGTGSLTLDNGGNQPLVTVSNQTTTISAPLAGSNGLRKNGAGLLVLSGDNSALSGTLFLENVSGTNNAGVALDGNASIGAISQITIDGAGGTPSSGAYLELRNGITIPSTTPITLNSAGGNSAPAGGIRTAGAGTVTINAPIAVTLNSARISNTGATRLEINGAITGGTNSIAFRQANNEGIHLTNTGNSWTGNTVHSGGTLTFEPGALPNSHIQLAASDPGTIQTHGTFTRALGSGVGEIAFAGTASRAQGIGARGGDLTVNFGGAGAPVLFDTNTGASTAFIRTNTLVLNGANADGKITLVNPLNLNGASRTIQVSANVAELTGGITGGAFDVTKTSTGTLRLSGPVTHAGNTVINGGTLELVGADNRLPTGGTLAFTGTSGALDLTTTSQTLAGLTVPDLLAASYTLSGTSLTLNGATNREFGPGGAVTNAHSITMDLSGLASFTSTAPANVFRIGHKSGATNSAPVPTNATVTLADTNSINAATFAIADVGSNSDGGGAIVRLGTTNTINSNTINIGASNRSDAWLEFASGLTNPTATIRDTAGTGRVASWLIGRVNTFFSASSSSVNFTTIADFSGGTVDALVDNLQIGTAESRRGQITAGFLMGKGTLDVTTITIGQIQGSPAAGNDANAILTAIGSFTLNDATGLVKAGTINLATNLITAGTSAVKTVSGTLNLTSGTLEATTIQRGAQTGIAGVTTAFNWTNGTLRNTSGVDLLIDSVPVNLAAGTHIFDATGANSITLNASSPLGGTGGFTKTGTGSLILEGPSTFAGIADVQQGTLAINNSVSADADFLVDAAATLSLANLALGVDEITGKALDIDGNLVIAGPVNIVFPGDPVGITDVLDHGSITGTGSLTTNYRNFSFNSGATSTSLTVAAGLPLTWTGASGDAWDLNTSMNWKDAGNNPQTFYWWDSVTFDEDGALIQPTVTLNGELRPAAVTVNSTTDYALGGTGTLAGPFTLTKNGTSTLTLGGSHSFDGGISIVGGTLKAGGNRALGANGQLITVSAGATLDANGAMNANRDYAIEISGSGVGGLGAIVNSGADVNNGLGSITLTGDASIGGTGRWDMRPITAGTAFVDLDGNTLTKIGSNTIALVDGSMTSAGTVRVNEGILGMSRMIVSGTGNIEINSGGTLSFENYSTGFIDQPVAISGGTLELIGNSNFTIDSTVALTGSGTVNVASGRVFTAAGAFNGTGGLTKTGAGALIMTADNGYSGITTVSAGTLQFGNLGLTGAPGSGDIVNDATLRFARIGNTTVANKISGSGGVIFGVPGQQTITEWDAVTTLTGANTFTGGISISSGGLKILNAAALGEGPKTISMNNGSAGRPQFYLDGSGGDIAVPAGVNFVTSTNQVTHPAIGNLAGNNSINGNITLQSGGGDTLVTVAGGSLALNGQIAAGTSGRNLRLAGANGADGTINGLLTNGTHPYGILVQGSNVWTFTNSSNNYTGATTINSGTLRINGDQIAANGAVTVNSGGTLGGTGTVGGNITANAGSSIAPGESIGTLNTAGPVNLAGTLAVEIDAATSDRLAVGGSLTLNGASLEITELAAPGAPVYIIASYGALSGTFGSITGMPTGYGVVYNYNNANQIALVSSASSPFGTWIDGFVSITDPADKLPGADPDDDGVNNLVEFALNGDPTDGGDNGLSASLIQDATAPAGEELTLIIAARRGASFGAGPNGTRTASIDGVNYTVEGSLNLVFPAGNVSHAGATDTAPAATGLPSLVGEDWEYHTFSLDSSEGLPGKGFLRVKIGD